jgi:hypothetical protein
VPCWDPDKQAETSLLAFGTKERLEPQVNYEDAID